MNAIGWLRARLRSHNRHAVGLALVSICAAVLAWCIAWAFFMLLLLGFATSIRGDIGTGSPPWAVGAISAIMALLFGWGLLDQMRHRFSGASDRQVIGWHLLPEFLLLPARLTFAIWGNFSAFRRLNDEELGRAWELLVTIRRNGKTHLRSLALLEPDADLLYRLVTALQMLDLIDLHRGEGDWFYTVRSTEFEQIGKLLGWQE
ncbi:MAG: hypothetical protein ACREKL_11960 [Chthoniobacterales bacterium]